MIRWQQGLPMPPLPAPAPFAFGRYDWLPVGVILPFAGQIDAAGDNPHGTDIESWGWLLCDGRKLNAGKYPELYAALGCLYGGEESDGEQYFYLPDYRGYFLRGVATDSNVDKGLAERKKNPGPGATGTADGLGSVQEGMVQMHEHQYENYPGKGAAPGNTGTVNPSTPQQPYTTGLYSDSSGAQSLSGTETRPVNVAINYIIKYACLGQPGLLPW
ncbi:MAG: phage tail protein [Desulfobulbaceae bacterium]|nr:phage tail protein [Desulfobulbaceae bacterium]